MAQGLNLNLKLDQKLVMTPQLQLAIKLLQMQAIDVQSFVDQEVLDNPLLQKEDETREQAAEAEKPDTREDSVDALESGSISDDQESGWDNMYDAGTEGFSGHGGSFDESESSWENLATSEVTLKEHLLAQLGTATTDATLSFLGQNIIDAVDDSGYLRLDIDDLAKRLKVKHTKVEEALALVQGFDPAGVAARDVAECLRLQMEAEGPLAVAEDVLLQNLDMLANGDLKKIARIAGVDLEDMQDAAQRLTTLTPKPGLLFGSDVANTVVPDVVVLKKEGKWVAELNADAMPKILLNNRSESWVNQSKGDDKNYMTERLSRAQWLIKSLEQRAKTIFKVTNTIVDLQQDFFDYGVESLTPMTLKAVAEAVGVHESTVSRVTNGKYMQTPLGMFELKFFFSSAINSTGGGVMIAAEGVKSMIKRLVQAEDPKKPLSDEKLVALLKDEGVDLARRTVAKYREALNIPSSSQRRQR